MSRETLKNIPQYYVKYVDLINESDLISALENSLKLWQTLMSKISVDKEEFAYEAGKWTVKELLQHIIDTERIFTYRALCIARGERTDLPGFDENSYTANSHANQRSLKDIANEFVLQRKSAIAFFKSLSPELMARQGRANGLVLSTETMGFVIVGHQVHHLNVLRSRYL